MKKRILLVTEASNMTTGFATYAAGLLKELHKNSDFEICEFGCQDNGNIPDVSWKYISNSPSELEEDSYKSNIENSFGKFKFTEACLSFQPHIVLSLMDYWSIQWINVHPYRKYFKFIPKAVVDAVPMIEEWVELFADADLTIPYSKFAQKALMEHGGNLINLHPEPCRAAVDTNVFKNLGKRKCREELGIDPNCFIVGMTSRNQHRKRFPELLEGFRLFLDKAPEEITKKTFLLLNTSYPDVGFDFASLLKRNSLSSRVLFVYYCSVCEKNTISFFRDSRSVCYHCKNNSLRFPGTYCGSSREQLAKIFNCFDVHAAINSNEGWGLGSGETSSCEVPLMTYMYSAMSDVLEIVNGIPLNILQLDTNIEFGCYRVIPNIKDIAEKLEWFFKLPEETRNQMGIMARKGIEKYCIWEKVSKVWSDAINSVEILPFEKSWGSPPDIHQIPNLPDKFNSINHFVDWLFVNILKEPNKVNSYFAMRMLRDLQNGFRPRTVPNSSVASENSSFGCFNNNQDPFTKELCLEEFIKIRHERNTAESLRMQVVSQPKRII